MKHSTHMTALLRHVTCARDFCRWLEQDGDQLIAAAHLLGGPDWAFRAEGIVATARNGGPVSAKCKTLRALSGLLHGCVADRLEGSASWPPISLDPDDPRAITAMRCAEALDRGLRAMEALRLAGLNTRGVTA